MFFWGIIIFLRVCCAFSLGYRAAGRGVRVMYPLPCGGIFLLCPGTSAHPYGTCGACCFVVHGRSFHFYAGGEKGLFDYLVAMQVYMPVSSS